MDESKGGVKKNFHGEKGRGQNIFDMSRWGEFLESMLLDTFSPEVAFSQSHEWRGCFPKLYGFAFKLKMVTHLEI